MEKYLRSCPGGIYTPPTSDQGVDQLYDAYLHYSGHCRSLLKQFAPRSWKNFRSFEPIARTDFSNAVMATRCDNGSTDAFRNYMYHVRHFLPLVTTAVDLTDAATQVILWNAYQRYKDFVCAADEKRAYSALGRYREFASQEELIAALMDESDTDPGFADTRTWFIAQLLHFQNSATVVGLEDDSTLVVHSQVDGSESRIPESDLRVISSRSRLHQLCQSEATLYQASNLWHDNVAV